MKTGVWIIIVVVALVVLIGGYFLLGNKYIPPTPNPTPSPTPAPGIPSYHSVAIEGFAFSPSNLTINKGEAVVWTNNDPVAHTVSSDSGSELASGTISMGQTYSHTFNTVGTFDYHCSIHTMMKAKIIVQ
jgi:plastocyanin